MRISGGLRSSIFFFTSPCPAPAFFASCAITCFPPSAPYFRFPPSFATGLHPFFSFPFELLCVFPRLFGAELLRLLSMDFNLNLMLESLTLLLSRRVRVRE